MSSGSPHSDQATSSQSLERAKLIRKKFDELRMTGELPSPSAIGLRILRLTQDEDYSVEELTSTIMADAALSGRIVRLANSVLREGVEPAATAREAAMRLGADTVRGVALGFTLVSDNRSGSCLAFDYDHYWSLSLASAVTVHHLARASEACDPVEAFTCGLLGDVGRLALASVHPERYSSLLTENPDVECASLISLEQQAFEIDHSEVAIALFQDWGLPDSYGLSVFQSKRSAEGDSSADPKVAAMAELLRTGRSVAEWLLSGRFTEQTEELKGEESSGELEQAGARIGLDPQALLESCLAIQDEWSEWSSLFDVPTQSKPIKASVPPAAAPPATISYTSEPDPLATEGSEEQSAGRPRILVVEDDEQMQRLIRFHLERAGYVVVTASSSEEGLDLALRQTPQIVIADWMLPGMSGVNLCETLRRTEAGRKMYILIVTAREDDEKAVEAFRAGADDYIVKPFNPRILLARIRAGERMMSMREQVEEAERARLRQVAELGILNRKLRSAALTDALTSLPNRRYAIDRLKQEWESSERTGRPLSVVMIDIDHFKQVNDLHGHEAGDVVLCEVSNAMRSQSRGGDVLCRLGGEEFLFIHVSCDEAQAQTFAERVRTTVAERLIQTDDGPLVVTISLGVAQRNPDMRGVDDLLRSADQALYLAKAMGRDRVHVYSEDMDRKSA